MTIAAGSQALASDIIAMQLTTKKVVSDTLRNSNDTSRNTTELSYTKVKEVKINAAIVAVRTKFTLASGAPHNAYAKIYKNGTPIGTQRTTGGSGVTFTEDFASWAVDDLIQIYAYTDDAGEPAVVTNFRFYYSDEFDKWGGASGEPFETTVLVQATPISVTNQDP